MNPISHFNSYELYLFIYLILINFLSFILFGIDKKRASRKAWRISESFLILISLLGGATGSIIGMVIFKHKLSKRKFTFGIPSILILNRLVKIMVLAYIKNKLMAG